MFHYSNLWAYIYKASITKALKLQKLTYIYILGNAGENLHVGEAGHVQTNKHKHEICLMCFARAPLLQHELLTIGIVLGTQVFFCCSSTLLLVFLLSHTNLMVSKFSYMYV